MIKYDIYSLCFLYELWFSGFIICLNFVIMFSSYILSLVSYGYVYLVIGCLVYFKFHY